MLAIVDPFGVWIGRVQRERCRPTPEEWLGLVDFHREAGSAQLGRGGKTCQPSSNDLDYGNDGVPPTVRSVIARATIQSFFQTVSLTRLSSTL